MQSQCLTNSAGAALSPGTCVVTCPPPGTPANAVPVATGDGSFVWQVPTGGGGAPLAGGITAYCDNGITPTVKADVYFSVAPTGSFTLVNLTAGQNVATGTAQQLPTTPPIHQVLLTGAASANNIYGLVDASGAVIAVHAVPVGFACTTGGS